VLANKDKFRKIESMQDVLAALQYEKSSGCSTSIFVISLFGCCPDLEAQGRRPVRYPLCMSLLVSLQYHFQCSSGRENCAVVDPCNFEPHILSFSFLKKITPHCSLTLPWTGKCEVWCERLGSWYTKPLEMQIH